MVQYARPDSDVVVGSWTIAPLFSKIDEVVADDADFIRATTNTLCEIGLSNISDPTSSDDHTIRIRAKKIGTGIATVGANLVQGASLIASYTIQATTVYATYPYALLAAEADAISDYTNLRFEFNSGIIPPATEVDISWAEFEVPDVAPGPVSRTHSETKAESNIFVHSAPSLSAYAQPTRLWRKNNQAAIMEFVVPTRIYYRNRDAQAALRQGSIIEMYYGLGTAQQRVFYGFLPAEGADREIEDSDMVRFTAIDFVGQLQSYLVTLGPSTSSFVDPVGHEIGGFVSHLVSAAIDAQFGAVDFSQSGIQGTSPAQFVTSENAIYGTGSVKKYVDSYSALAYDDTSYPDSPLLYEHHQRDNYFVWRKQRSLITGIPTLTLTVGRDAILGGVVRRESIYTDVVATGKTAAANWRHADRDSSRRWGGRRFVSSARTTSSFQSGAYEAAVRNVEMRKHERVSFSLTTARSPFLLYPGDLVDVRGASAYGITDKMYRVQEVTVSLTPAPKTTLTVEDAAKLLTDYL